MRLIVSLPEDVNRFFLVIPHVAVVVCMSDSCFVKHKGFNQVEHMLASWMFSNSGPNSVLVLGNNKLLFVAIAVVKHCLMFMFACFEDCPR